MDPKVTQNIIADITTGLNIALQILNLLHTQENAPTTAVAATSK